MAGEVTLSSCAKQTVIVDRMLEHPPIWTMPSRELFFRNVHGLIPSGAMVLDFGAGRGKNRTPGRDDILNLQAAGRYVIGVDVDPVIVENSKMDRAVVWDGHREIAPEASIDVLVANAVFEHVRTGEVGIAAALSKAVKPGGWICVHTPNRWGYVALGARVVPNALHNFVLRWLSPARQDEDSFPTYYRMNTLRRIGQLFPSEQFENLSFSYAGPPSYTRGLKMLSIVAKVWEAIGPKRSLHIYLRKRFG